MGNYGIMLFIEPKNISAGATVQAFDVIQKSLGNLNKLVVQAHVFISCYIELFRE
jgi:hypothetical protein